jgi:hypothetical protein
VVKIGFRVAAVTESIYPSTASLQKDTAETRVSSVYNCCSFLCRLGQRVENQPKVDGWSSLIALAYHM